MEAPAGQHLRKPTIGHTLRWRYGLLGIAVLTSGSTSKMTKDNG